MKIDGITLLIAVDGKLCLAPIKAEAAELFVGLLPPLQPGDPEKGTMLLNLPPHLAQMAQELGTALQDHVAKARAQAQTKAQPQ
jgi:hypothetical protein